MALPKIDLPLMEIKQPSTGNIVKYRPFTVKEEKILLVAQEADDPAAEILAMKQIIGNCFYDLDVDETPMIDLEYFLLILRSSSVDNKIKFSVTDPDTEENTELEIDLNEVHVKFNDSHTDEIKINDRYSLFLKYPTIDAFIKIADMAPEDPLTTYNIMTSCLDKIAAEDEIEYFKDYTDKEIEQFMDDMPADTLNKILNFFETLPKLRHEIKYKNSNGKEQTFVVEGARSFFI